MEKDNSVSNEFIVIATKRMVPFNFPYSGVISVYLNVAKILRTYPGRGKEIFMKRKRKTFALDIGKVFIGNDTKDSAALWSRNITLEVIFYRRHRAVLHDSNINAEKYFQRMFPLIKRFFFIYFPCSIFPSDYDLRQRNDKNHRVPEANTAVPQ